jgi:hypothetical protein
VFFVRPSAGRLYLKWQRFRDSLYKAGLIKRRSYVRNDKKSDPEVNDEDQANSGNAEETDDAEDAGESSLVLLKTVCAPWGDVVRHWLASFDQRQRLLNESDSTHSYLLMFPALKNKNALELVSQNSYN